MIKVVPAIIPVNKLQIEEEIEKVYSFAKLVQVDISDGIFTPVKTWPYNGKDTEYFELLKKESEGWPRWEETDIEIHLMVQNPENVLDDWIQTGVTSVIAHIEATDDFQKIIDKCREKNVSVGLAIKPSTPIEKIDQFVKQVYPVGDLEGSQRESISNGVDFIQVMGSDQLGRHGVELEDKAVEMIKALRTKYPESIIAIDIGVNEDTAGILVEAGANKLISGGAILKAENPKAVFDFLSSH